MRQFRTSGSVRGAPSDRCPYRDSRDDRLETTQPTGDNVPSTLHLGAFQEGTDAFRVVGAVQGRRTERGVRLVVVGRAVEDTGDGFLDRALGDA